MTDPILRFICALLDGIVDNPDDVNVRLEESDHKLLYLICLHPSDVGKVLGERGTNANAIRKLAIAIARKNRMKNVYLMIGDASRPEFKI